MMLLLGAEFLPGTAIRRYQHPTMGVLVVQTLYGREGSADLIQLHAAVLAARLLRRIRAGEDVLTRPQVSERKAPGRRPRKSQRPPRGSDTKPAA
jgi:hypothetical protein